MNRLYKFFTILSFIIVFWHATPLTTRGEVFSSAKDSFITSKVIIKLAYVAHINPLKLIVHTKNGTVILRGNIPSKSHYVDTLRLVKNTTGVKTVNIKDLYIRHVNLSLTDSYITAKVETAVLKAKVFDDETIPLAGISAQTKNGVVTLSGQLKRQSAIDAIMKRVSKIKGVKYVDTQFTLENKDDKNERTTV